MRKLFAIMVAAALGLGVVNQASAAPSMSWQVVSGTPGAMNPGDTVVVSLLYTIDIPLVTSAVSFAEIIGTGLSVTRAQTTSAGSGASILTNFDLRAAGGIAVGATCANSGGGTIRTCDGPPNGVGAGGFGGLSFTGFNQGTYSVGTMTIVATGAGPSELRSLISLGGGEWQQSGNDLVPQPQGAVLNFNVIPEPTTAALLGLGLAGLVAVGRRNRA